MQSRISNCSRMVNRWLTVFFCIAILSFAAKGNAQLAGTGSIQGSIADATGAIIQNATVTVTNIATQVKHTAVTGGSGLYSFPNMDIGTYTLEVVAQGFEHYSQSNIVLEVGSSIAVNVPMTVGRTDQKIEVQASGLALQTEDASFKQTIDHQAMTEMPLNGRQMTGLITLSGGSTTAPAGDFTGSKYSYAAISVSIAGGGGNTTMWRLDGGDNNDYMANANLPFPFPDAVSQFSVESTVLGASDGQHTGGLVNVVTRSGTNSYHGSAFEFIRNNYLDATNFFSTCTPVAPATTCTAKDTLHQNQFGGTFGGKILRDKLFAFAGYQRLHNDQSQAATQAHVPTAANLAGDFSVTDGPNCSATASQLRDPLTGATLVGNKYPSQPTYNPQSLSLLTYLPKPIPTVDTQGCGLISYAIPSVVSDNQFVTRVDWTINARNNLFGRYFIDGYQAPAFYSPTNILITTQSGNVERVQSFTMGEAFTISSSTVNSAHATILRRSNNRGYASNAINASAFGISSANLYQPVPNGLYLATGKFTIGGGTNSVSHFNDNTLALDDDVTMIRGRHQILWGGEWVQNQLNIGNAYETNGVFTFASSFSAYGPSGQRATGAPSEPGDQSLDFLMGTMSAFQQSKQQQNALRGPVPSLYAQDTFHATKQLTVTGGLRWSPNFMPVDVFNRGVVFNMSNFLANKPSSVYTNAPAGATFYGDPGVTRQFTKNSPWQFAPNLGLSYDPYGTGKTVMRAGASLGYDQVNFYTSQRNQQNPPYATAISQQQISATAPISFSSPWSVGAITVNPFPQPQIPTPATAQFFPQSQFIVMPAQFHASYTIQWTASVQQEFGHGWQFQLQYIGNRTDHAPIGLPLSPAVYIPGVWGAGGTGCAGIVTTGPAAVKPGAAGTACSTTNNQTSRFALTIANPGVVPSAGVLDHGGNQYLGGGGGTVLIGDSATANYNGMVATLQHRLSSTFSLLANYTWSKCLNIADSQGDLASTLVQNPNNPRGDYAPCGSDFRHVANVVIVTKSQFQLPRVEALLLNNWEFAPLVHIISGAPFTVTSGQDNSLTDVGNDRPNLVSGVPVYIHIANRSGSGAVNRGYLNPAAFSQIPTSAFGGYGNLGRNTFRGLPAYQVDAQISRIFPIYERLNMTLRLEAFNMLNHPNLNAPTGTSTGTAAGQTGGAGVLTSSTFGQLSSTSNQARVFQGSVKFVF
jgi:Carboxypeptidase regulatory-like domain